MNGEEVRVGPATAVMKWYAQALPQVPLCSLICLARVHLPAVVFLSTMSSRGDVAVGASASTSVPESESSSSEKESSLSSEFS